MTRHAIVRDLSVVARLQGRGEAKGVQLLGDQKTTTKSKQAEERSKSMVNSRKSWGLAGE